MGKISRKVVKYYIFIFTTETDGFHVIHRMSGDEIRKFVKKKKMSSYDYSIIEGDILKSFNNSSFDLKKL